MDSFNPEIIKLGISSCLMGQQVRFDGGHKGSKYCINILSQHFQFVPLCPEMAIGMGAPRKSVRLMQDADKLYVRSADGSLDVTDELTQFSEQKVKQLASLGGYILCAKSPTCGMESVMLYKAGSDHGSKIGIGVFARALMARYPNLPVEEEGRLNDGLIRENFFTRIYAYHDWQCLQLAGLTKHELMRFHARYKYLLMAHSPERYRLLGSTLGSRLANLRGEIAAVAEVYFSEFMAILKIKATRNNHTSVLQHIQGYFKQHLSKAQKHELSEAIFKYHQGLQPLLVPISLINHYLREHPTDYIAQQVYLKPHPESLKLRYAL